MSRYRGGSRGAKREHVLVAEKALGHPLPAGAQVHHVDNDGRNNANRNLVICQDASYHKLLHTRTLVVRAGGDPNTEKFCGDCRRAKPWSAFHVRTHNQTSGRQSVCKDCQRLREVSRPRCGQDGCQNWPRFPHPCCRRHGAPYKPRRAA